VLGASKALAQSLLLRWGILRLTLYVKMGYNTSMVASFLSFVLRTLLVVMLWFFVWRFVEPRTQLMRIARAALLVLCLLGVLVVLKITGGN